MKSLAHCQKMVALKSRPCTRATKRSRSKLCCSWSATTVLATATRHVSTKMGAISDAVNVTQQQLSDALSNAGCDESVAADRLYVKKEEDNDDEEEEEESDENDDNDPDVPIEDDLSRKFHANDVTSRVELEILCEDADAVREATDTMNTGLAGVILPEDMDTDDIPDWNNQMDYSVLMQALKDTDRCKVPSEDGCSKCEDKETECREDYKKRVDEANDGELVLVSTSWTAVGCQKPYEGDFDQLASVFDENATEGDDDTGLGVPASAETVSVSLVASALALFLAAAI